jgi:hypothetical protein
MSLFDKLRTRTRRGLVPEIKTKSVSNVVDPSVEDSNDDEGEGEDIRGNMHGRALKKKCGKGVCFVCIFSCLMVNNLIMYPIPPSVLMQVKRRERRTRIVT